MHSLSMLKRLLGVGVILTLGADYARSATLTWDADGVPPAGGGAGTWDTTNTRWYDGVGNVSWNNAGQIPGTIDDAVFGNTAGAVVVQAGGVTAQALQFDTTGYSLSGGTITLVGGTGTINVNLTSAQVATLTSTLGGSTGLTKTGNGILALGVAAGYTGNTSINAGTIRLEAGNALNTAGSLNIATGATFQLYRGSGAGSVGNERYAQTVSGLTGGGTLIFGQGPTASDALTINLSGTSTFTGNISSNAGSGNNKHAEIALTGSGTQILSGTDNVSYTGLVLGANTTLKVGSSTALPYFSFSGSGSGKLDLNGYNSSFYFGQSQTTEVTNSNSGQVSQLWQAETNQLRSMNTKITGNIQLVAKINNSTMFLNNTSNTFTGGLQLDAGAAIRYANAGSLPAGTINFNGGRLEFGAFNGTVFNADVAATRIYKVQAGTGGEAGAFRSTTTAAGSPSSIIIRGTIDNATGVSNPGNLRFHGFGTSGQTNNATYTLHGGGTYTGQLIIGESTSSISSFTLRPGVANGLPTNATLGFVGGNGTTQTFNLNGLSQQLAGITNTDAVTGYTARVINTGAAATFTVNNTADFTYNGKLGDTGGNAFGLTKSGAGQLTLTGPGAYTGSTTIQNGTLIAANNSALGSGSVNLDGGTLKVNSGITLANTISYTANGGTLTGVGAVTSALTLGTNAVIAPGNSPGTLATGAQTWAGGGKYVWEVDQVTLAGGDQDSLKGIDPGFDFLNITGVLDIAATTGSKFTIDITGLTHAGHALGGVTNWDNTKPYTWVIAS